MVIQIIMSRAFLFRASNLPCKSHAWGRSKLVGEINTCYRKAKAGLKIRFLLFKPACRYFIKTLLCQGDTDLHACPCVGNGW
jgi:hypothetical protein